MVSLYPMVEPLEWSSLRKHGRRARVLDRFGRGVVVGA